MIKIKIIISIALLLYCGSSIFATSPRSSFVHYPTILIASQPDDSTNLPPIAQTPRKNPFLQEKLESLINDQVIIQQQAPQRPIYEKLTKSQVTVTIVANYLQIFCCVQPFTCVYYTNLHRLAHYGLFDNLDLCHQIIDAFDMQDVTAKQTDIILNTKDYDLFDPETSDRIISITFNSNDMQQIYTIAKKTLEAKDENRFVR